MRWVCLFVWAVVACNDPEPKTPQKQDQVPANSLDDTKLQTADTKSKDDDDNATDPSQPYTTKVGDAPSDPSQPAPSSSAAPAKNGGKSGGKGAVSKAECDKVMDKYLSLEIAGNPALAGVSPDAIAQAKQMMKQQHGEMPCDATRAQYNCAMAATSTAAWQKCMK